MAYKLIWAPSARLDLKELSSYIAESRPVLSEIMAPHRISYRP